MSWTARLNAASFTFDGLFIPLILRTYCSAASWTSSLVASGSKLCRGRMLRHMPPLSRHGEGGRQLEHLAADPRQRGVVAGDALVDPAGDRPHLARAHAARGDRRGS